MDTHNSLKEELNEIHNKITSLFSDVKSIPGLTGHSFKGWEKTCSEIHKQMSEDIVRVAIVGAVKSGKSTFINSLFRGDYLKRGAGVVTSIVTRVQSGHPLTAKLFFKSWDEVNSDMEQAMVLFPSLNWRSDKERFDIRREKDRMELQQAMDALSTDQLITNDTRNVNSVLLASYLKGYDRVKGIVSSDTFTTQYKNNLFKEHKAFVGDDSLAAYLRDVQLQIDSSGMESNIEIADCQGCDSPNPLHLAMIQDYLLLTHLIVYVVSSRTGLRQADIKFLSIIKKMGIMDNILFVINCDYGEHESLNNLNNLIVKVKEEISLIKPEPLIYTFSALYNLFKAQKNNLTPKDKLRFRQWKKEKEFTAFLDLQTERFESSFYHKLTSERNALLLKNHLERFGVISSGMDHWVCINQDILARDTSSVKDIILKIEQHQKKMGQIKSMIRRTLDGSIQQVKQELVADIDRFFDVRSGEILGTIIEFIRNYNVSYNQYEDSLISTGFSGTLYLVFQELKQALDTCLAEAINPDLIRFVRKKEALIKEYLESVADSYEVMVQDAIVEYNSAMKNFGITRLLDNGHRVALPDINSIKGTMGLTIPPLAANMRYSVKIKTEAVMRLGFYSAVKILKRLLRKPIQNKNEGEILALKDGVIRIKRETEKSIIFLFKDYKENIKFQYIFKLADAVSEKLYDALLDRFQTYVTDLSKINELISEKRIDKERASEVLGEMERTTKRIHERINRVREKIELSA